jgi:hypothetical protein
VIHPRVTIERDSTAKQLENNLLQQMSSIIKQNEPEEKKIEQEIVQTVSVEDAIKELLSMETK